MSSKFSIFFSFILLLFLITQPFSALSRNLKFKKISLQNFQDLKVSTNQGQTVKGIGEIKKYLQNYGYYPNDLIELSDEFDEHLKFALEAYQKNYHLNITGTLNSATIKEMVPRCGCPDIVNHNLSTKHFHNTGKLHLVSHYSFFNSKRKWSFYNLTYSFSGAQVVEQQELRGVCSRAFKKWSDVSKFKFQEVPAGGKSDIKISFESGDHGDGYPFDGRNGDLAHASPPTYGLFHYNAAVNWSINPIDNQIDLESVTVHEIGHLLGLGHSQDRNAVMYANLSPATIKRDLTRDDINGINALYHFT